MILFIYNFRKHKLAHSEIQQITGCLGTGRWVGNKDRQGENSKGHKNILTGDGYVHNLDCGHGFMVVYKCQNISN